MDILTRIPLNAIIDLHPTLKAIDKSLQLPPLSAVPLQLVTPKTLRTALNLYPVQVKKYKGGYVCTGNAKLYKFASSMLPPEEMIPVIEKGRKFPPEEIERAYLTELYISPLLFQISKDDGRRLFRAWQNHPEEEEHPIPPCKHSTFSRAFRISLNALNKIEVRKPTK